MGIGVGPDHLGPHINRPGQPNLQSYQPMRLIKKLNNNSKINFQNYKQPANQPG